jgi:hypothetical protein
MEDSIFFNNLDDYLPDYFKTKESILITDIIVYILSDRDLIMLYSAVLYMVSHPFTVIKVIFVNHFLQFVFVLMRCIYQASRPIWRGTTILTNLCFSCYANPSMHFFFASFFYLYLIICYQVQNKKKKKLSIMKKILIMFFYIFSIIFFGVIILAKKINFLYQLIFAFTSSLITIVIALDLENVIHNYIFNSLKNVFKIRKYKIQLFLILLSLNVFSVFVYNFIQVNTTDPISVNEAFNNNCSKAEISHLGIKSTFLDITYIYGILGAYWGASFTVENNIGEWWVNSVWNLLIKVLITTTIGAVFLLIFSKFF